MVLGFFAELAFPVISIVLGFGLGVIALVVMIGIRRAQARVARMVEVEDPGGGVWSVRVVYGFRRNWSERLAGMSAEARRNRRDAGHEVTAVGPDEIWHPRRLVDRYEELAGVIAPFVVLGVVLIAVIFVVQLIIAIPIGIAVFVISTIRGRWRVEVTSPDGARSIIESTSLAEARETRTRLAEQIVAGADPTVL